MANQRHLEVLGQGVVEWNEWRGRHGTVVPDLRDADLEAAKLTGADLSLSNLSGARLFKASLIGVDLTAATLVGADLRDADLTGAKLTAVDLIDADVRGAHLLNVEMRGANLLNTDLSGADLSGANLFSASLHSTNLSRANLSHTNLSGALLRSADFTQASTGNTYFTDVDLREAEGLETIEHWGPSEVSVSTIYRSEGQIPEIFLRGCGVPEDFITYLRSLTTKAIDFYSCFISYSSKDQGFAERLHADLQAKGVRVWFAPHNMPIGARLRPTIDESIRVYDKLLLVLSEHSVSSQWVEQEVESALRKERQSGGGTVLFPVRLDNTVLEVNEGWPALIKDTRNIGDFTGWKDHDSYQKAFDRLLRDLKAIEHIGYAWDAAEGESIAIQLISEFEEIRANIALSTLAHVIAAELKRLKTFLHRHSFLLYRNDVSNFYANWVAPFEIPLEFGASLNLKQAQYEQMKEQLMNIDLRSASS